MGWIFPLHQGDSYILQRVEDIVKVVQTVSKFPVHVELWMKGSHEDVALPRQRRWRCLYFDSMSPSSENECSGSHEASEIG